LTDSFNLFLREFIDRGHSVSLGGFTFLKPHLSSLQPIQISLKQSSIGLKPYKIRFFSHGTASSN
jgi:hypothetical protein